MTGPARISALTGLKLDHGGLQLGFDLVVGHLLPGSVASVNCNIKLGVKSSGSNVDRASVHTPDCSTRALCSRSDSVRRYRRAPSQPLMYAWSSTTLWVACCTIRFSCSTWKYLRNT